MKGKPDNYYDLAIVDPPYGIGVNKMTLGNGKNKIYRGQNDWDNCIPTKEYFDELKRVSKHQVVWGGNYMTQYLIPTSAWLFWDKGTGANDFADGELAWTSFGGALRKINISWVGANAKNGYKRIHPTEKPILLYRWILTRHAIKGMKILDTHGGSFTNAIACDMEGFDLDIIEIDKVYFDNGLKAFDNYKKQLTLFNTTRNG